MLTCTRTETSDADGPESVAIHSSPGSMKMSSVMSPEVTMAFGVLVDTVGLKVVSSILVTGGLMRGPTSTVGACIVTPIEILPGSIVTMA